MAAAVSSGVYANAEQHFLQAGQFENRAPSPFFDPNLYLAANPDVAAAIQAGTLQSAFDHFQTFGITESRDPGVFFDADFYLASNPDIAAAVAGGQTTAFQHFLEFGLNEVRDSSPFFDAQAYLDANPDIAAAVASGAITAYQHFTQFGFQEARDLGSGISLGFFANDPEAQAAFASGDFAALFARVAEVAPFIETFEVPAGYSIPSNQPIPTDFVPPAGETLVVPAGVVVPPGTQLPPTFEQPSEPPVVEPPVTPPPSGGGGGGGQPPVGPGNEAPVADPVTETGNEDTAIPVTLTADDVDGTVASFTLATVPENGQLYLASDVTDGVANDGAVPLVAGASIPAADAALFFLPDEDFNGDVTFTYTATDNEGSTSEAATATITVTPVNDPTTATGLTQSLTVAEDASATPLFGTDPVVADIDTDDQVTATLTLSNPEAGTLAGGSGTFDPDAGVYAVSGTVAQVNAALAEVTFAPAADFNGNASVAVTVTDGEQESPVTGTVSLTVTPVNDPAEIGGDLARTVTEDKADPVTGTLTVTDVDGADEEAFVLQDEETLDYGTFSITAEGDYTYVVDTDSTAFETLGTGQTVTETIRVETEDGTIGTITITITGVDDSL